MKYCYLLLFFGLMLGACKKQPEKTQATLEKITESVYASGVIKSKNQYQVYSTVSGLIQKILVKEGDIVKAGDPLFVVQSESSKLNAENAALSADFADKNKRGERLDELKSSIETAKSKMLSDSVLLIRQRGLWAQQIGSKFELEQRELAYSSSLNNYKGILSRYDDLVRQLNFAAAQSKKLLAISQAMEKDFIVRSQRAGRVYSITKEVGELISPQMAIAIIGDSNDFVAELQIDENDIARVAAGQRILLTLDSYKGQVFEAVLTEIDPIMNERTRTFKAEANFTKKPAVLYPNLTTEANIVIHSKEKTVTIPRAYLVEDSLVILENKEKRRVEIGLKDYQKAEVLSGLSAGETILKPIK